MKQTSSTDPDALVDSEIATSRHLVGGIAPFVTCGRAYICGILTEINGL